MDVSADLALDGGRLMVCPDREVSVGTLPARLGRVNPHQFVPLGSSFLSLSQPSIFLLPPNVRNREQTTLFFDPKSGHQTSMDSKSLAPKALSPP